jgi:hypothetical protein
MNLFGIEVYRKFGSCFQISEKLKSKNTMQKPANQGRLEAGSMCSKNTGAEGAATVNRAPNAKGKGAKREMNIQ